MNTVIRTFVLVVVSTTAVSACAQVPEGLPKDTTGRWLTESGNLEVAIAPCGEALCGTVVRVITNRSMSNPNVDMAPVDSRSVLGLQILFDFTRAGANEWQGQIYNREDGKTYSCLMSLVAPDHLRVRSYVGLPIIGKTQIWTRVVDRAAK
jgi:uncharacterized protein (DUF2147 family)